MFVKFGQLTCGHGNTCGVLVNRGAVHYVIGRQVAALAHALVVQVPGLRHVDAQEGGKVLVGGITLHRGDAHHAREIGAVATCTHFKRPFISLVEVVCLI